MSAESKSEKSNDSDEGAAFKLSQFVYRVVHPLLKVNLFGCAPYENYRRLGVMLHRFDIRIWEQRMTSASLQHICAAREVCRR